LINNKKELENDARGKLLFPEPGWNTILVWLSLHGFITFRYMVATINTKDETSKVWV